MTAASDIRRIRRIRRGDVPAIVAMLAADHLGRVVGSLQQRVPGLGFARSHVGMTIRF